MEINIAHGNKDEIVLAFSTMGLVVEIPLSSSDVERIEKLIEFTRKNFRNKEDVRGRTFADKISAKHIAIKTKLPETAKLIGTIQSAKLGGEMPFGLHLVIGLENGKGVDWVITKDLERIYQFCRDAGVEYINELVGKPVECILKEDGLARRIIECAIAKQLITGK